MTVWPAVDPACSCPARIERAKRDWKDGRFPRSPGDDLEFIPLPE